jgi:uncharacterized repeat protein (TIGR03803 family)
MSQEKLCLTGISGNKHQRGLDKDSMGARRKPSGRRFATLAGIAFLGVAFACSTAAAQSFSLSGGWSSTNNPNPPWSYNQGSTPLPLVPVWTAGGTGLLGCNQPAWAPSNIPGNFLPALFQAANSCSTNFFGPDPNNGMANVFLNDVVVHTVDSANGNPNNGVANVLFTLPAGDAGNYQISGTVWDAGLAEGTSRPQDWQLLVNGVSKASGVLSGIVSRSEATIFGTYVHLAAGDTVDLELYKDPSSSFGYLVGTNLSLTAETYTVLHSFTGGGDGGTPLAGVTIDAQGNLYGTTSAGGVGFGTVYKMKEKNGFWTIAPLYKFAGGDDGATPEARVVIGTNGTLYGTTNAGGGSATCTAPAGCGTVFNLHPTPTIPATVLTPWIENVLYRFLGGADGAYPGYGDIVFDSAGDIYNTASQGGTFACSGHLGCGAVYELTRSGQTYTQSVIYDFTGGSDGAFPLGAVAFDHAGNLDTTAWEGGINNGGSVIQLAPNGSGWTETTIHQFTAASDGSGPYAGVIVDSAGNLYGSASSGGANAGGTIFKMTPSGNSWTYSVLQSLTGAGAAGSLRNLFMDAAGNLYGTAAVAGAYSFGSVFKLTPSNGGWIYTDIYDFTGGTDGSNPNSNIVLDSAGNIYGTASAGGADGKGVVFEITP